jgi:hypothetical protein
MVKSKLQTYWGYFKAAFPFIITLWGMFIISYITFKIFNPETDVSLNLVSVLGLIFTLVSLPIHNWFKNRKS